MKILDKMFRVNVIYLDKKGYKLKYFYDYEIMKLNIKIFGKLNLDFKVYKLINGDDDRYG